MFRFKPFTAQDAREVPIKQQQGLVNKLIERYEITVAHLFNFIKREASKGNNYYDVDSESMIAFLHQTLMENTNDIIKYLQDAGYNVSYFDEKNIFRISW
jgi:hypothetical protein